MRGSKLRGLDDALRKARETKRHEQRKSRNAAVLDDFVRFCHAHPELRFWQALSAWVSGTVCVRIAGARPAGLRDTFYWEGKDGP